MKFLKFAAIVLCGLLLNAITAHAAGVPQTLFEMAGAKREAARLSDSVLVIIDAQREYIDGALPLTGVNEAVAEIGKLLARARQSGTPAIHVMHKGKGGLFDPASPGFEIAAPLHPLAHETIVEKSRVSAFAGTGLAEVLQHIGRKNLIVVGFMTHNCVSSTARDARDLGYAPTIIAAATATRALPDGKGGVIPASALQAASLAELADRTAAVAQSENDIKE